MPGSLINIFTEYQRDLQPTTPTDGDLTPWTRPGVLLLNRVLTTAPRKPRAHSGKGWEVVTDQAIRGLVARDTRTVAILWGKDARGLKPLLGNVPCIESSHPSPYSADYGFFGSRPFSPADDLLTQQGAQPVDWRLALMRPPSCGLTRWCRCRRRRG